MGGYVEAWVDVGPIWAEVTLPTGRVESIAQQLAAVVAAEVRARYRPDIAAGMRLVHGSDTYRIEAALPDNKRTMLRLLCSTVANI